MDPNADPPKSGNMPLEKKNKSFCFGVAETDIVQKSCTEYISISEISITNIRNSAFKSKDFKPHN